MTHTKKQLDRVGLLAFPENGAVPYVKRFLADRGYQFMPDCSIVDGEGRMLRGSEVESELRNQHLSDRCTLIKSLRADNDKRPPPERLTKEALADGFTLVRQTKRDEYLAETVARLQYDETPEDGMRLFVRAVRGEDDVLVTAALQHWLANVKRRMLGRAVVYHLFPVFVGKQEGGKTTALKKLLAPISWYTMNLNVMTSLTDERNFHSLSEKYVCILDEMARAEKTDAQTLKSLITAEQLSARVLSTNHRDRLAANCSFVGTTNIPVTSLIYDPTGMRRFVEVRCADLLDWQTINSLDFQAVWRSIDPDRDYLTPVREELKAHQEELRQPTQVEEFCEDVKITPGEVDNDNHRKTNEVIFANYVSWAVRAGKRNLLDKVSLSRAMKDLGYVSWKSGGQRGRWVKPPTRFERAGKWAEQGLEEIQEASSGHQWSDGALVPDKKS